MFRVRCIETGEEFDTLSLAAESVDRSPGALSMAIKNQTVCGGRTWQKIIDPPYTVYKLTFPSGMIYIGQTSQSLKKRFVRGSAYKNTNARMYKDILECGWDNVDIQIVDRAQTIEEALAKERKYILEYQSSNPDQGYNTVENFNTVATPEEKLKRRRTYQRARNNQKPQQTVICVETGIEYESATAAALELGLNNSHISEICRGSETRHTCGGYHWTYGKIRLEGEE